MIIKKVQEYIFVPDKSFGQFLDVSPKTYTFLKVFTPNFHVLKYDLLIKILNLKG